MRGKKILAIAFSAILALGSSFNAPKVVSYWFDMNDVFVAGPSEPQVEISRINMPTMNCTVSYCPNCFLYERGFTSKTTNNEPAGINNQNIYCFTKITYRR